MDHLELHNRVKDYYYLSQQHGRTIMNTMADFLDVQLPQDLTSLGFEEGEVRRHGQIVGGMLLRNDRKIQSSALPESDLLQSGN